MREESVEEGPVAAFLTVASRSGHSKEGSNVSHGGCAMERTPMKSRCYPNARKLAFFLFYIKKIKISKICGRFRKLRKWAPIAHGVGDRPPVAPCRPGNGRQGHFCHFFVEFFLRTGPWRGTWCRGAGRPPPNGRHGGLSPPTVDRGAALFKPPSPLTPHSIL